jgi:hypothetical protein
MTSTIGTRLLRQVVTAIVAVMAIFGVLDIWRERAEARQGFDAKQARILEQLQIGLETALWNLNKPQVDRIVRAYLIDPDLRAIAVTEGETTMSHFARTGARGGGEAPAPEAPSVATGDDAPRSFRYQSSPGRIGSGHKVGTTERGAGF